VTGNPVRMNGEVTGYMVYGFGFGDIATVKDASRFNKIMQCYYTPS
jgi:hypothetical protein